MKSLENKHANKHSSQSLGQNEIPKPYKCLCWSKNEIYSQVVVAHTFHHSSREAEASASLSSRPAWSKEQVPEQPELHRQTLSQRNHKKHIETERERERFTYINNICPKRETKHTLYKPIFSLLCRWGETGDWIGRSHHPRKICKTHT